MSESSQMGKLSPNIDFASEYSFSSVILLVVVIYIVCGMRHWNLNEY